MKNNRCECVIPHTHTATPTYNTRNKEFTPMKKNLNTASDGAMALTPPLHETANT